MGNKVDYGALQNLLGAYKNATDEWGNGIASVMDKALAIEASTSIAGNRASRMKQYLDMAYSCAKDGMALVLGLFVQNYMVYNEDYHGLVDAAADTHITADELSNLHSDLNEKRGQFQKIGLAAESAVGKITDLISLPSLGIDGPDGKFGAILTSLDDLDQKINDLESTHCSGDFAEIDTTISWMDSYLAELIGQSKDFKTDFSAESFLALASVPGLIASMHEGFARMEAQEGEVASAVAKLEKRLEQERLEREKREKQAKWAKVGVGIVVGVISAAVLVTTGPVGAIVVGAVSGAVTSAFDAAADEYAEKGWNFGEWNTNKIMVHGCIGGVTGMITGLAPPGLGPYAKAGIKAASSAFESAATTAYDQFEASGRITDVKQIAGNALLSGGSSFAGNLVGNAVSDRMGDWVKSNDTIKDLNENVVGGFKHFGATLQVEGASELAGGAAKRFTSTAVKEGVGFIGSVAEGKSAAEAWKEHNVLAEGLKDAVAPDKIVGDAGSAVATAATDNPLYASQKKLNARTDDYYQYGDSPVLSGKQNGWKDWDSEENDRMLESLRQMDERSPEEAREYNIFGDPRSFAAQRNAAVNEAWEQERRLVMQGRGTRDWTVSQQEELIRTGKVSGFDGSHMLDASSNPSAAGNPDNIQFLTYEEHIYGAHGGNTRNPTTGHFDPATGETTPINPGQIPHREKTAFELSNKYDYTQSDLAEQLGPSFGYGRGK